MKVFILPAYPDATWGPFAAQWIKDCAAMDVHGQHTLTPDADAADVILFMDGHSSTFAERPVWHRLRRRHRAKSFVYQDGDYAFPLMPGIYPSLLTRHRKPGMSAGGVYLARIEENKSVSRARTLQVEQDLLYSFVGANNCEVRDRILRNRTADTHVVDTSGKHAWLLSAEEREKYENDYAQVCARSRFILAPRGIGPSTYRLYEAMELGRCPVILSDDWVAPPFIPWERFSIRIKESQVADLPRILADQPHEELGRAAREVWEQYVDRAHCFHYLIETIGVLLEERVHAKASHPYLDLMQSDMRNFYLRDKLRYAKTRLKSLLGR